MFDNDFKDILCNQIKDILCNKQTMSMCLDNSNLELRGFMTT